MILVTGGTGRLGSQVVTRLVARGERVRILTRDPARASALVGPQVELVAGDLRTPASLPPAVAGVSTVIAAAHGFAGPGRVSPASVDRDGNARLIDAAREVGSGVVLISVIGASPVHPLELFRMKAAAEEHLRVSGCPWTIVRSSAFLELYLDLLRRSAGRRGRPIVFGRGANPINFVSVVHVAAVVEMAVLDTSLRGQVLEIGGPQNSTLNELARLTQPPRDTRGARPRHVPQAVLRALAASGAVIHSPIARQAAAALFVDTTDMTFNAEPLHTTHPYFPATTVTELVTAPIEQPSRKT